MKIIILGALPSSLLNFRGELIKSIVEQEHELVAMANNATSDEIEAIKVLGAKYVDYPVERSGLNPLKDFNTYRHLKKVFNSEKPDVILAYTIKPIIWGGFAARHATKKIKFWGLVTGLGFAFQEGNIIKNALVKTISFLYKKSLRNCEGVIFQNQDNRNVFIKKRIVNKKRSYLVNGSGVDTNLFDFSPVSETKEVVFLLIARLLVDKGVREFLEAAKIVKKKHQDARFIIVGPEDSSPNAISENELLSYQENDVVKFYGSQKDVKPFLKESSVFVLPSYHEGLPRSVIEAMSIGRPIITTLAPGCKDTVNEGANGFLIPIKQVEPLVEKMNYFIENREKIVEFGKVSRSLAISKYNVHEVNKTLIEIMRLEEND